MLSLKIPFEERGVVRKTLLPLRFNKKEKVWQVKDTDAGRYHISKNGMSKYCEDDLSIADKYEEHDIVCKHEAWRHQKKAFDVVSNYKSSYIYMLPGVGKSKVIVDYYNTNLPDRTLIVCPKNVIPTWRAQFDEHCTRDFIMLSMLKGSSKKKEEQLKKHSAWRFVCVVNYDSIWRIEHFLKMEWDLVVFDEVHRLQSGSTSVNKFCRKLKAEKVVGMTGTPGEPKKWYGQFYCLDENLFGKNQKKFLEKYFRLDYFGNPVSVLDKDSLTQDFALLSHIEDKPDTIDIPDAVHNIVELENGCKKEYRSIEDEFMLELENGEVTAANAMVKTLKLRQICSGFVKDDEGGITEFSTVKKDWLKDWLKDMEGLNVVVFYNFKHEMEQIKEAADGRPFGNISGSRRDMECITDPKPGTVIAIQIRAGGTGIDGLQHHYDYCVYYSLTWSEIDHVQSGYRVHRAGRDSIAFFYYLITSGTVEEKVFKALKNKQKILQEVAGVS